VFQKLTEPDELGFGDARQAGLENCVHPCCSTVRNGTTGRMAWL
jgi:hypothetical protein